jgi:hypothetical protein
MCKLNMPIRPINRMTRETITSMREKPLLLLDIPSNLRVTAKKMTGDNKISLKNLILTAQSSPTTKHSVVLIMQPVILGSINPFFYTLFLLTKKKHPR